MSASELAEHQGYLGDSAKLRAYGEALGAVVEPTSVVLDLGAGTGILGLLAARAGAKRVHAVDSGPIIGLARQLAEANGVTERIVSHRETSTRLELDEPVDVAVCDQIGGFVYDAGVLDYFADTRERLLAPGGVLVPASFELWVAPVAASKARQAVDFWRTPRAGFDVSAAFEHAANTEWRIFEPEMTALSDPMLVARIAADSLEPVKAASELEVSVDGVLDGLVGWFVAELAPGVQLTNSPFAADRFSRWCNFYPVRDAVDVVAGERLRVSVDLRPRVPAMTWSVTVTSPAGERRASSKHSTLLGRFLASEDLPVATRTLPSERVAPARQVLDLLDAGESVGTIRAMVEAEHRTSFASTAHLNDFVDALVYWCAQRAGTP